MAEHEAGGCPSSPWWAVGGQRQEKGPETLKGGVPLVSLALHAGGPPRMLGLQGLDRQGADLHWRWAGRAPTSTGAGRAGRRPPLEPPWGTVLVTATRAASDLWT